MKFKLMFLSVILAILVIGCGSQQAPQSAPVAGPVSPPVVEKVVAPDPVESVTEIVEPEVITEPVVDPDPAEVVPIAPVSNVKEISITAKRFEFVPSTITVDKGDTVKLSITSEDTTHGFALLDFGVRETLSPGKTVNAEFVADKSGEFTFFCSISCGSGHGGMKGKLVVN